jgi:hypothetical protein
VSSTWKLPQYTWGEERELCKRCAHLIERITSTRYADKSVVMACALNNRHTSGKYQHGTCIDMRYEGECGRKGLLFQERQA